jgi:steroid delta-isomerase-like uncharacterized protein
MTFMERWYEEVWNKGQESAIDAMAEPDAIAHGLGEDGGDVEGVENFKVFFRTFQSALSDIRVVVEDTITEGDRSVARVKVTAKHTGASLGVPAKGNTVQFSGVSIARLKDGKIAEAWNYFDFPTMYKQMV